MAKLGWQRLYPVEGDSAVAELLIDDEVWGDLELENLMLDRRGDERLAEATVVLRLFGSPVKVDLDSALGLIQEARSWLLENERGRQP